MDFCKKVEGAPHPPCFVAEMNSSHGGNVAMAKKMIEAAKQVGCDVVKFQSWSATSLYSESYYAQNPIAKRMVGKFSLDVESLCELAEYCNELGMGFSSTPYSRSEVDQLVALRAAYIKVASMDLNNPLFLQYIGETGMPVVLSTGMGTLAEIRAAVKTLEEVGNRNICILHCVSVYPASAEAVNLNNMRMLQREFPEYSIGYSDHTIGGSVACAATALGAAMIEKHFTLDNTRIGWDNQMATEPAEMKRMIDDCKIVYHSLGSYDRTVSEQEKEQRLKMRRSIVAARDLEIGHVIAIEDLDAKRPGNGISPDRYEELLGKVIKTSVKKDMLILEENLT